MLRFSPKRNDAKLTAVRKEVKLLEKGEYKFVVVSAKPKMSKGGNEMIELRLAIKDNKGTETVVWDYLLEKMAFKLQHFCQSVGLDDIYAEGTLSADDCLYKSGMCKIKIQDSEGFPTRNAVHDYIPGSLKIESNQTSFVDDELPPF